MQLFEVALIWLEKCRQSAGKLHNSYNAQTQSKYVKTNSCSGKKENQVFNIQEYAQQKEMCKIIF